MAKKPSANRPGRTGKGGKSGKPASRLATIAGTVIGLLVIAAFALQQLGVIELEVGDPAAAPQDSPAAPPPPTSNRPDSSWRS